MEKKVLIKHLSVKNSMPQSEATYLLDTVLDEFIKVLVEGDSFRHRDFGVFKSVIREERIGYHPLKRKKMLLPRKRKIKFSPSAYLKRLINE